MRTAPDQAAPRTGGESNGRKPPRKRRPEGQTFRQRIVPKTVIGTVTMLLAAAVGFAFGGTILYAYYQYRLDRIDDRVTQFIGGFEDRYELARQEIDRATEAAKGDIRAELEPLKELRASGATLTSLIDQVKDSVYLVETQDEFGQPRVGTAFVVTSDAERSYLVTSLSVVQAATRRPGPGIILRKGDETHQTTLHTWQEERDLALLIVNRGSWPRLKWAPADAAPDFGERVFVVAGSGGAGGAITQGSVADVSAAGIQHDAAATGAFAGGPLINSDGEVVGVATPAYAPLGFTSDRITFASLIRSVCEQVLRCPDNAADAGGARGAGERR